MTDFGPWISMAREVQGISRLDLAERTRISVFDLIRIENGAMTTCTVSVLVRLMGELGYGLEPVKKGTAADGTAHGQNCGPRLRGA